ncbi:MAG: Shedu anti-phage system protein SduA domain-containing protein [Victivallales bacterium]
MKNDEFENFIFRLTGNLNDSVFNVIYTALSINPRLRETLNPAFPFPKLLRIGVLNKCLAVEYQGPEVKEEEQFKSEAIYQPNYSVFDFLGIEMSHLKTPTLPITDNVFDFSFFCGHSITYLTEYFYDFTQGPSNYMMVNGFIDLNDPKQSHVVSNTTYFWSDPGGGLKIRHIDFLELIPLDENENVLYHTEESYAVFAESIMRTRLPLYQVKLHGILNSFIELVSLPGISEPVITHFLEQNPEILQLAFGANQLNPQVMLIWQYDAGKPNLKPDFLFQRMDGYCDILDFKLPDLKSEPIVGTATRQHPSSEIDTAIAQLNEYELWCSQEINRNWLKEAKGIKIHDPVKYLVIGHSSDFSASDRQRLRSTRNTFVFTYDEFIEMARYQLYRIR